jgi:Tol biopolymer transport system component
MTELKELFEVTTTQMEPDQDSWREQQRKQDRSSRNRRVGALVGVAAMLVIAAVVALNVWPDAEPTPSVLDTPRDAPLEGYYLIGLERGSPIQLPGPEGSSWYRPSPDGERIAFVQPDEEGVDQLFAMEQDGSNVTQLTSGRRDALEPAWSPDSASLAFSGVSVDGSRELFILEPSGGVTQITTLRSGDVWQPTWSPDGSTIAFVIYNTSVTIASVEIDGSRMHRVIPVAFSPTWSPDGTQIAYTAGPSGANRASIANADGSRRRPITDVASSWPFWSPDGSQIAYGVEELGEVGLYVQDIATGEARLVSTEFCPEGWLDDETLLVTTTC